MRMKREVWENGGKEIEGWERVRREARESAWEGGMGWRGEEGGERGKTRRRVEGGVELGRVVKGTERDRRERGGAYPSKGSTHCKFMVDNWHEILCQLHVKLHIVGSVCSGLPQGCYGVLCRCRLAAPSNRHKHNERTHLVITCSYNSHPIDNKPQPPGEL